jgi:cysteine desulfuration protein SufE
VRAFAGILAEGLSGLTPEEVLAVPLDFYRGSGLESVITPRRLHGLEAALRRIQDQLKRKLGTA